MFIVGWLAGFLVAAVVSVGTTLLFWPHGFALAFGVGCLLGSTLPWLGAFLADA